MSSTNSGEGTSEGVGNDPTLQHQPLPSPVQAGGVTHRSGGNFEGDPVAPDASSPGRSKMERAMVWTPGRNLEGPDYFSRAHNVSDGGTEAPKREDLVLSVEMGVSSGEGKPAERLNILETSDQKHYTVVAYSDHDAVDSKDPIMMTTTTPVNAEDMPSLWEKLIAAQADDDYCKIGQS